MQELHLTKRELDFKEYTRRPANSADFDTLIKEDSIIYHDGKPLLLYFKFDADTAGVRRAIQKIPYQVNHRTGGLTTQSRIFGFDPSTGIRKQWCSATLLGIENPNEHQVITEFAREIMPVYKKYLPEAFEAHKEASKKILPEWLIPDTIFSSGIINKNNQLNYHWDTGNFEGVYSNMIVFKSNCSGGYLSLPEYNVGLECSDNTLVMFDGQSILHGVTPMKLFGDKAYRYSIVYYTLQAIWKCEEIDKELLKVRANRAKTEKRNFNL